MKPHLGEAVRLPIRDGIEWQPAVAIEGAYRLAQALRAVVCESVDGTAPCVIQDGEPVIFAYGAQELDGKMCQPSTDLLCHELAHLVHGRINGTAGLPHYGLPFYRVDEAPDRLRAFELAVIALQDQFLEAVTPRLPSP